MALRRNNLFYYIYNIYIYFSEFIDSYYFRAMKKKYQIKALYL